MFSKLISFFLIVMFFLVQTASAGVANVDNGTKMILDYDNPVVVTGAISSSTIIFKDKARVLAIYWYNPTISHLCAFQDINKDPKFAMLATVGTQGLMAPFGWGEVFDGMRMDDLDSGTIYIYLEKIE